jgi:hypothetical protein
VRRAQPAFRLRERARRIFNADGQTEVPFQLFADAHVLPSGNVLRDQRDAVTGMDKPRYADARRARGAAVARGEKPGGDGLHLADDKIHREARPDLERRPIEDGPGKIGNDADDVRCTQVDPQGHAVARVHGEVLRSAPGVRIAKAAHRDDAFRKEALNSDRHSFLVH